MASNCCQLFNTDLSVAISGIAGPGGGALRKPVGTVFICTYFKNRLAAKKHNFSGTRIQIKKQSVFTAIDSLIGHIESQVKNSL
jgi:PncC family amidohydrolase